MPIKLIDAILASALGRQPGRPIEIEDDQTQCVYVLVARERFRPARRRHPAASLANLVFRPSSDLVALSASWDARCSPR